MKRGFWWLFPLTSCAVTPLTNKIAVGEEAFVIGVGEGPDSLTDLFAAPAGGGNFVRLSFNRAIERAPRLAPEGVRVAFLRRAPASTQWSLVILELRSGAEQRAPLPPEAGEPEVLGWSRDGQAVIVRAQGYFQTVAPAGELALARLTTDLGLADSLTGQLLGEPLRGKIEQCRDGNPCILSATGELTLLGAGVTGAIRWGTDSVAYWSSGSFEVRPLAGGQRRRPDWQGRPAGLRDISYHPGNQVTTRTGVSGRR